VADDDTADIVVTLDGTRHSVRLGEVTARQVMLVREAFGMTPRIFVRLIAAEQAARAAGGDENQFLDLPEIAAFVFLARLQAEGPDVPVTEVLDGIQFDSEVHVQLPDRIDEEGVPDLDPPL